MANMTFLLRIVTLTLILVSAAVITPKANAQTNPLAANKVHAKEEVVAEHAARKRACKAEAKERGLHFKERRAYIKGCMNR
jgi:sulfur relay (sulfurtransferase) complex TusBCD TusD component (DsrE family)